MARKRLRDLYSNEAVKFFKNVVEDKPLLPFLVPLVLGAWAVERWLVPFSNWVPLAVVLWAMIQHGRFQRQQLVEDLNKKWTRLILNTLPITPLEPCQWLNKLLMEFWPNFLDPKLSKRFQTIVEKRLKHRKPMLIERIQLLDFSLGSCPPSLGMNGARWLTSGDQLLFMPIIDGQAILYSFVSTPEVRIGVVFGSGGSQTLPATELPGVSSWLDKLFTDTLVKTMVEPRRRCYPLPPVDLRKKAVGGVLSVTVVSASKVVRNSKGSSSERRQNSTGSSPEGSSGGRVLQTLVEVELGELTRRTDVRQGSSPRWDATFNMVLHENMGTLKFYLYEWAASNVKYDLLTSCEVKMTYVADDSTIFWAIGPGSSALAKQVEHCGKEVELVLPFEGINSGELTVRLVLREWQFSDGSNSFNNSAHLSPQQSVYGSPSFQSRTGRKLKITVLEGRDLLAKDRSGKNDPYVKLQYGKSLHRTRTISHALNLVWNEKFEFDEIGGGEYLKIKCYSVDYFGDDNIGCARVNLEGLVEASPRDVWVPLERVNSGELRLLIEVVKSDDGEGTKNGMMVSGNGWIELVLIEAKDLVAADLRGTSDPYVRVQYGNIKKRTKVVHKTLNPQWNQTLEFPDNGSPLMLHVKDHNAVLPTSSIGDCVVEYDRLPPNQMADKWIPLQGVKNGEIHIQITRKAPKLEKKSSVDSGISAFSKAHQISSQFKEIIMKFRGLVEEGDLEGLSLALSEIEGVEYMHGGYMVQLEREKSLLIEKINELDHEINVSTASP
ncbi:uncharacterized protein LOC131235526 isoform X2 [Magnolia sinica]|uniref:uncharacterized protein LOC131235526 isoform X2 n=1 Tax=Magnolia sinica TaxID=86752 RepID=UPI0026593A01|nr:uncharacterized protein LOC131235526 isoform X2 [Magnolia sinica]